MRIPDHGLNYVLRVVPVRLSQKTSVGRRNQEVRGPLLGISLEKLICGYEVGLEPFLTIL